MTTRSIDTTEGHELTIGGADLSDGSQGVTFMDTTRQPSGCWLSLTVAEARAVAAALSEYAHAADLANLEAETIAASGNPYELACDRFNKISGAVPGIRKAAETLIQWAEDEYTAAQDNLRKYETKPGIPLPEYRQERWNLAKPALSVRPGA